MYKEIEIKILSKFFTNIEGDVYCATDAMPSSLWAFLTGGYSRSDLSMRDRFLAIFTEMSNSKEEYFDDLESLVGNDITSDAFIKILEKASKFMSKWALEYGHNSLKDSANDRIAIENVSIRATKILENISLGAIQEKSTRYMDFSVDNFYIPESEFVTDVEIQILKDSMTLYRKTLAAAIEYFKTVINKNDFKSEAAWTRTCKAKAFDEARYLLPTSTRTSLGITLPTRETERWLSELLASPEKEIQDLAILIKNECVKINPGLLTHVQANDFLVTRNTEICKRLYAKADQETLEESGRELRYNAPDNNTESKILTNFIAACGIFNPTKISPEDAIIAMDESLATRGKFDEFPKWTAVGDNMFRFCIDIGAYRDVQRHRVGTQIPSDWCPLYGYTIPDLLKLPEFKDLRNEYVSLCDRITSSIGKLYKNDRFAAAYFLILGTNINVIYVCTFRQLAYFIELRSGKTGHYSYRRLAQDMYFEIKDYYPNLHKHIRVDLDGYADRREAEERIQQKIKEAEADS